MVLSLLASYAMHKLFHKISNCISASKNSSIVTFFQLCHKPSSFLVMLGGHLEWPPDVRQKLGHFTDYY